MGKGEGWERLGLLRGFSLNETRCVVGPVRGGILEEVGGGGKCVNLWIVPPVIWTDLGFWYLGRRPGIYIPGGQGEGVWRVEDGSAGGQRAEGGRWGGGVRMGRPSLTPLRLLLAFSLPLHVFSCSSCRSPHSLSGSYRQEFKGPLPYASSAGTTEASGRTRWSEGDWDRRAIRKTFICEFSSVCLMSDVHDEEICIKQGSRGCRLVFRRRLGRSIKGEMCLLATFLVRAIHVTVAPLSQLCLALTRAKITWPTVCVVLAPCFRDSNRGVDRKRGTES